MYFLLCMIILLLIISVVSFIIASYPIFVASCQTAAASKANHIVNDETTEIMKRYTYHDLIDIEKDENGNVALIKSNTMLINQMVSQIVSHIQNELDNTPTITVFINYGSVSGITKLKKWGPKFDIELEAAGKINTEVKSEFESVNVNQTLHKIYLNLNTSVSILTPIGSYGKEIDSKILLTEAIIVGEVPETYYNLEGMNNSDVLEVMQ